MLSDQFFNPFAKRQLLHIDFQVMWLKVINLQVFVQMLSAQSFSPFAWKLPTWFSRCPKKVDVPYLISGPVVKGQDQLLVFGFMFYIFSLLTPLLQNCQTWYRSSPMRVYYSYRFLCHKVKVKVLNIALCVINWDLKIVLIDSYQTCYCVCH